MSLIGIPSDLTDPNIPSNVLASKQFQTLMELLGEGEIEGFPSATGSKGSTEYNTSALKDVFLNGTQVLQQSAGTSPSDADFHVSDAASAASDVDSAADADSAPSGADSDVFDAAHDASAAGSARPNADSSASDGDTILSMTTPKIWKASNSIICGYAGSAGLGQILQFMKWRKNDSILIIFYSIYNIILFIDIRCLNY